MLLKINWYTTLQKIIHGNYSMKQEQLQRKKGDKFIIHGLKIFRKKRKT